MSVLANATYSRQQTEERKRLQQTLPRLRGAARERAQDKIALLSREIIEMPLDPRSSAFGTIRLAGAATGAQIDLTAGLRPFINFFTRSLITLANNFAFLTYEDRMPNFVTGAGRERSDWEFGSMSTPQALLISFLAMRANPVPRLALTDYSKGVVFDRDTNIYKDAFTNIFPLSLTIPIETAYQTVGEDTGRSAAMSFILNFLGIGSFEVPENVKQQERDRRAKERAKKREEAQRRAQEQ
jgi:hypothetical protein